MKASSSNHALDATKKKKKRADLIKVKKENGWTDRVFNKAPIPEDKGGPRTQMRRFNNMSKKVAQDNAEKGKTASTWMENVLRSSFDNVPLKLTPSLRDKAGKEIQNKETAEELEIIQKIIVRENLLGELNRLLDNHNGVYGVLGEIHELVKAIRFQTVDIVEDIESWQSMQMNRRPFLFRGDNYLSKISQDMAHLDKYPDIADSFDFKFTGNPFTYAPDFGTFSRKDASSSAARMMDIFEKSGVYDANASVEGVDMLRIKNCEKTIQRNTDYVLARKYNNRSSGNNSDSNKSQVDGVAAGNSDQSLDIGEAGMSMVSTNGESIKRKTLVGAGGKGFSGNSASMMSLNSKASASRLAMSSLDKEKKKVWNKKFSALRTKKERIATLSEELDGLRAMRAHLEDKIDSKARAYSEGMEQKNILEARRKQAVELGREIAAQHIAVEASIAYAELQTINSEVKEMQREIYFFDLEIKRKDMILKKLETDIQTVQRQVSIEKKLSNKIKKEGLVSALKTLNEFSIEEMSSPNRRTEKMQQIADSIVNYNEEEDVIEDSQNMHTGEVGTSVDESNISDASIYTAETFDDSSMMKGRENMKSKLSRVDSSNEFRIGEGAFVSTIEGSIEEANEAFFSSIDESVRNSSPSRPGTVGTYSRPGTSVEQINLPSGTGVAAVKAIRSEELKLSGIQKAAFSSSENIKNDNIATGRTSVYTDGDSYSSYITDSEMSGYSSYSVTPNLSAREQVEIKSEGIIVAAASKLHTEVDTHEMVVDMKVDDEKIDDEVDDEKIDEEDVDDEKIVVNKEEDRNFYTDTPGKMKEVDNVHEVFEQNEEDLDRAPDLVTDKLTEVEGLQCKVSSQEEKIKAIEAALEKQLQNEANQKEEKAYLANQEAQKYTALEDDEGKRNLETLSLAKNASIAATRTLDEQMEIENTAISVRRQELERVLQAEADERRRKAEDAASLQKQKLELEVMQAEVIAKTEQDRLAQEARIAAKDEAAAEAAKAIVSNLSPTQEGESIISQSGDNDSISGVSVESQSSSYIETRKESIQNLSENAKQLNTITSKADKSFSLFEIAGERFEEESTKMSLLVRARAFEFFRDDYTAMCKCHESFIEKLNSHSNAPQEILQAIKTFYNKKMVTIMDLQDIMRNVESDGVVVNSVQLLPKDPAAMATIDAALANLKELMGEESSSEDESDFSSESADRSDRDSSVVSSGGEDD